MGVLRTFHRKLISIGGVRGVTIPKQIVNQADYKNRKWLDSVGVNIMMVDRRKLQSLLSSPDFLSDRNGVLIIPVFKDDEHESL